MLQSVHDACPWFTCLSVWQSLREIVVKFLSVLVSPAKCACACARRRVRVHARGSSWSHTCRERSPQSSSFCIPSASGTFPSARCTSRLKRCIQSCSCRRLSSSQSGTTHALLLRGIGWSGRPRCRYILCRLHPSNPFRRSQRSLRRGPGQAKRPRGRRRSVTGENALQHASGEAGSATDSGGGGVLFGFWGCRPVLLRTAS